MAKFDFKGIMKGGMETGKVLLPVTAGIIGAQKFMDFRTILPNVKPDEWYMKHQGAIKFGGVVITLAMWKKCPPLVKYLLWGIAIQGAIQETRVLTMNTEGKAFVDSIGAGQYDSAIDEMADMIKRESMNGPTPITDNSYSSVAGMGMTNPELTLSRNSQTGVAGMGMGNDWEDAA